MHRFSAFLFAVIVLVGCSTKEELPDTAITITPFPAQAGQDIEIRYFPKHPKAKFPNEKEIYASIGITTVTGGREYRLAMQHTGDVFHADYEVPDDATNISIYVGPLEELRYVHKADGVIYRGDKAVEHSLFIEIRGAGSYEEARHHFDEDARLYPESTDRYAALWLGRVRHGVDTTTILREADSLFKGISAYIHEQGSRMDVNQLTAALACGYVYTKYGDLGQVLEITDQAARFVRHHKAMPTAARSMVYEIWRGLADRAYDGVSIEHEDRRRIYKNLISMALDSRNPFLVTRTLQSGFTPLDENKIGLKEMREIVQSDEFLQRYADALLRMSEDELVSEDNLVWEVQKALMEQGHYETCIAVSEHALPGIDSSMLAVRWDKSKPVDWFRPYGIEAAIRFKLATAYMRTGKIAQAHAIMKELATRSYHPYRTYQMKQSAIELATYYAGIGGRDSAAKYLGYALQMDEPGYDDRYDQIKNMLNGDFPSRKKLISTYYRPDLLARSICPAYTLETDKRTYKLGAKNKDSLVILFTSKTCGVCRVEIPRTLRQLNEKKTKLPQIIIVSDESRDEVIRYLKEVDYSDVEFAKVDPKFMRKIKVRGFPSHAVISGKDIVSKGGVGKGTYGIILNALEIQ